MPAPSSSSSRRWTIQDLYARYLVEPTLADIYVEGPADSHLIEWFLGRHGRTNWRVYPIETVEVPDELVLGAGLHVGARGRIITLGLTLGSMLADADCVKPVFVADLDVDSGNPAAPAPPELCLLTDFTSMELYAFSTQTIDKYLRLVLQTGRIGAEEVLSRLTPALVDVFLLRVALNRHGIGVIEGIRGCCSSNYHGVSVDLGELATRSINSAGTAVRPAVPDILSNVEELRRSMPRDPRQTIHGHDFVDLLTWLVEPHARPQPFRQKEVVGRALRGCLDIETLTDHRLFRELLRRTSR